MVLDSTRYAIEQSARVLRGMNFWGKIANAFSEAPKVIPSATRFFVFALVKFLVAAASAHAERVEHSVG